MALPFLLPESDRQIGFACFLHESLDQGKDVLAMAKRGSPTRL